jgi:hypothetical protein
LAEVSTDGAAQLRRQAPQDVAKHTLWCQLRRGRKRYHVAELAGEAAELLT